jgi:hypothetical protein
MSLGYITWKGIDQHMEVQLTVTHGLEPCKITINTPPFADIETGGTLSLRQGNNVINFFDCRADLVDVYEDGEGLEMWTITILDRRWRWKFGQISGYYNVRVENIIRDGTEKHIKDLMKLCLEAMGEKNFDLSTVPTNVFPEVEWNYTLPAEALARLADLIGYRIVFQVHRNRVAILKAGVGRRLKQENATDYAATFDPPELPSALRFVGSRILWEMHLPLEAVAEDVDHKIKLLDDETLSYRPPKGWGKYDPSFSNVIYDKKVSLVTGETSLRHFAMANVFRKYRVMPKQRSGLGSTVRSLILRHPGGKVEAKTLDQLLPLLQTRLATYEVGIDRTTQKARRAKPAVIWGQFDPGDATHELNAEDKDIRSSSGGPNWLPDGSPPKSLVYHDGWNLDVETGIITFDRPVFSVKSSYVSYRRADGSTYLQYEPVYTPATLWLRTSFGCRNDKTRAWTAWEIEQKIDPRSRTKPLYLHHDDVPLSLLIGANGAVQTVQIANKDASEAGYRKASKFYINEAVKTLQIRDPVAVTYPFLRKEELDGAIMQVTWMITANGAFTKVSRNREEPILGYSYAEQRLFQQVSTRLTDAETARAKADIAARAPGRG